MNGKMNREQLEAFLKDLKEVPAFNPEEDCPFCSGKVRARGRCDGREFTIMGWCPQDHIDRWHTVFGVCGAFFRRAYLDYADEDDFEIAVKENRLEEAKRFLRAYVLGDPLDGIQLELCRHSSVLERS